jgi:hypothetical protein
MDLSRPLQVVTPTVDGDVLAALARTNAAFTVSRLHAVLSRHSADGIRRSVNRLVQQGVVLAEPVGSAYLYRLNRDHLAARPIVELAFLREALLDRLRVLIAGWPYPPLFGALFGSAARGTMSIESDIDIVLVRPSHAADEVWDRGVSALARQVSVWTGNDGRVLEFDESELASGRQPVLDDVLREGIPIAGSLDWLRHARETV